MPMTKHAMVMLTQNGPISERLYRRWMSWLAISDQTRQRSIGERRSASISLASALEPRNRAGDGSPMEACALIGDELT